MNALTGVAKRKSSGAASIASVELNILNSSDSKKVCPRVRNGSLLDAKRRAPPPSDVGRSILHCARLLQYEMHFELFNSWRDSFSYTLVAPNCFRLDLFFTLLVYETFIESISDGHDLFFGLRGGVNVTRDVLRSMPVSNKHDTYGFGYKPAYGRWLVAKARRNKALELNLLKPILYTNRFSFPFESAAHSFIFFFLQGTINQQPQHA